jgi:hypothetical protein
MVVGSVGLGSGSAATIYRSVYPPLVWNFAYVGLLVWFALFALTDASLVLSIGAGCGRVIGDIYNGTLPYTFSGDCEINIPAVRHGRTLQRFNYEIMRNSGNLSVFMFQFDPDSVVFDYKCSVESLVEFVGLDIRTHLHVVMQPCAEFDVYDGGEVDLSVKIIQPEEYIDEAGKLYGFVCFSSVGLGNENYYVYFDHCEFPTNYASRRVQFYPYQNLMSKIYCPLCAVMQGSEGTYAKGHCVSALTWNFDYGGGWAIARGDHRLSVYRGYNNVLDFQRRDVPCMISQVPHGRFGALRTECG